MTGQGLTVALLGKSFDWGGGVDFLRYLATGLLAKQNQCRLKLYLMLPIVNKVESSVDVLRVLVRSVKGSVARRRPWLALPLPDFHSGTFDSFDHISAGQFEIVYYDSSISGMLRCLKRLNADVVLPVNGTLGRDFPIPWIGYVYDFQHKYFPENFSSAECVARDIDFVRRLRDAKVLIVNSKAVKEDIRRFHPWKAVEDIVNLPFAPSATIPWLETSNASSGMEYELPRRYFLISNQFWVHKGHVTAFKALLLAGEAADVSLICTGAIHDYRQASYIENLKRYISESGLGEKVRLLGHIPKADQIQVMKGAIAVIQPTFFEGGPGGGSVYDAAALGVPIILSDIPVNREVNAENLRFFRPGDHEHLAGLMLEVMAANLMRPSKAALLAMSQSNLSILGDCLLNAIGKARHGREAE